MFKLNRSFIASAMLTQFFALASFASDLSHWVDTRIGTAASPTAKLGAPSEKVGNTQPTGVVPFGMVQWGPDTDHPGAGSYQYADSHITGFSFTHLSGPGCSSTSDLSLMPLENQNAFNESALFSHDQEDAHAGLYSVVLSDGIQVELTTTPRTGAGRFTFPANFSPILKLSHHGDLHLVDSKHFSGSVTGGNFCGTKNVYSIYYFIEFAEAPATIDLSKNGMTLFGFDPKLVQQVNVRVGISYVSEAEAQANLAAENKTSDFDSVEASAENAWNQILGSVQVTGGTDDANRTFYTALYHSLLHPNVFSDADGSYIGFDKAIHNVREVPGQSIQYANFSGWDIYRSQIQLLSFLFPTISSDVVQSLVNDGNQCGALPKWANNNDETGVMVGDPGALIVANAYAFGATHFDSHSALNLMNRSGSVPGVKCNRFEVRPDLKLYLKDGYVPRDTGFFKVNDHSVSVTTEYATADFAVSQFAKALNDQATAKKFYQQSTSWKNLFDAKSGYLQARYQDHGWYSPFDWSHPFRSKFNFDSIKGFTEGNSAQYTWTISFDADSMIQNLGGVDQTKARLNSFFGELNAWNNAPYEWIGNEPTFDVPWLYNWLGSPELTQSIISKIMDENFSSQASGIPGNDDLGATSSWYVWSALGMYPAIPGVGGFTLSHPQFPNVDIHFENGKVLSLDSTAGAFTQAVSLNQATVASPWILWSQLKDGGSMHFELGLQAQAWGSAPPSAKDFSN